MQHSVRNMSRNRPRAFSKDNFAVDGMAFLQNPRGRNCYGSLGIAINSTQYLFILLTLPTPEGLLDQWPTARSCCRASPTPVTAGNLLGQLANRPERYSWVWNVLSPATAKEADPVSRSLLGTEDARHGLHCRGDILDP